MTDPAVIQVSDVSFSYNRNPVLKNVTFTVHEREFLALIGPNGGGKTTLLKLLLGLIKPNTGEILVFDKPPTKSAHRMGYVPQDVAINKSFPISVMDVVLMGRLHSQGRRGISKQDRLAACNALERLEMLEYQHRRIDDLSGGQRERVFIARALAADPDLLLLDEPIANLDNTSRGELYELLKEINRTKTILVVSHDMLVLSTYVTAVACVNKEVHYHGKAEITEGMMEMGYHCPVELIAHGIPHRILKTHER